MADLTAASFDYRRLLTRTDPDSPPTHVDIAALDPDAVDPADADAGYHQATRNRILATWALTCPDPAVLAAMAGVLDHYLRYATDQGVHSWHDTTAETLGRFIDRGSSHDARTLRKNTLHAAFLALKACGLHEAASAALGLGPAPSPKRTGGRKARPKTKRPRYNDRGCVRPATHDEVLLVRVASHVAITSRTEHLTAAAVAITTATATSSEAAQVLWDHLALGHDGPRVALAGRPASDGRASTAIRSRDVSLDTWQDGALRSWRGEHHHVAPTASVLYAGRLPLDSNSAQSCVDQQVGKAITIADLDAQPGLTAGSLRLWAAIRYAADLATAELAAARAGTGLDTLHRQLTRGGERSWIL